MDRKLRSVQGDVDRNEKCPWPYRVCNDLTLLPLDNKDAILTDDIYRGIFLNQNDRILHCWLCFLCSLVLTHRGRVTHICVSKLTIIVPDNGLLPDRRQSIIWTNAGILLIRNLGTDFSEILSEIHIFSFKEIRLKTSSAKWRSFCLGLNVLRWHFITSIVGKENYHTNSILFQ